LAGVGALFAYSKRETLRLASELNRARAEGAASFDKLDTCIASHRVAEREAQSCREVKTREENEFKAALDRIARSDNANDAALSRQMQALEASLMARIRSCENDADTAARLRSDERERLTGDWHRRESELAFDRDDQRRLAEARAGELARCRADLESEAHTQSERAAPAGNSATFPSSTSIAPPLSSGMPPNSGTPPSSGPPNTGTSGTPGNPPTSSSASPSPTVE
jgi:hypothetical protein